MVVVNEEGRREAFGRYGYKVLVVWSKELTKGGENDHEALVSKIKRFHEDLCD